MKSDKCPTPRPVRQALPKCSVLVLALLPALSVDHASAAALRCTPEVQYACTQTDCARASEGFQHAESFAFDPDARRLDSCLWTSCYHGTGEVLRGVAGGGFTAFGLLQADSDTAASPLVLSLTIDEQDRFVAVWQYAGAGLTFDLGRCRRVEDGEADGGTR